jgi:hypothetical protein
MEWRRGSWRTGVDVGELGGERVRAGASSKAARWSGEELVEERRGPGGGRAGSRWRGPATSWWSSGVCGAGVGGRVGALHRAADHVTPDDDRLHQRRRNPREMRMRRMDLLMEQ